MRMKLKTIQLNSLGIDEASQTIDQWLSERKLKQKDILRIRLTSEELLSMIASRSGSGATATLRLVKRLGSVLLSIGYEGDKYDPTHPADIGLEEWSAEILSRTGILPTWRWNNGRNELLFRIRGAAVRPEIIMLCSFAVAVIIGLLGGFIPDGIKTAVSDFALSFLAQGFLNLLNTFIGLMIFLSIITGICGIGNASAFSRIGKLMLSRYLLISLLFCGVFTFIASLVFHVGGGSAASGSSQLHALLQTVFSIIPSDPFSPFINGNTLQIIFLGIVVGLILLFAGSRLENLRHVINQLQTLIMKAVSIVCKFLPVYIFSSLLMQLWTNGPDMFLRLWKPLVFCIAVSVIVDIFYLTVTCRKLKVKASVLCRKLVPDFIITLTTASSSAAFSTSLDINENKLGISKEISRTGAPIGVMLFCGTFTLLYIITAAHLAEYYDVSADIAWWITLCIVSWLLAMSTPPVAGGMISCLSIMFLQLHIPQAGLATAATLAMLLDFLCTASRMPTLHMELALQANRLGMLDLETLRK